MNLKENKKAGFFGKIFLLVIFLAAILVILSYIGKAETATDIINFTVIINSSNVVVNVSNNIYSFKNSNATIYIQQNFSVFYITNISNATVTCNNSSISVSCICPNNCPSVNCNISEVGLNNETKTQFFNHYRAELGNDLKIKIEESSNKISTDLAFQLAPAKAEVEGLKQQAFNATLNEQKQAGNVLGLTAVIGQKDVEIVQKEREITLLFIVIVVESFVFVLFLFFTFEGFDIVDRFRNKGGGNY